MTAAAVRPKTARVKLAALIEDYGVYPRHAIDASHASNLAEAIRSGADLPPVVVEAKSMRIVDGWHRTRAWRKVLGAGGEISAELRSYTSEADLLKDAIGLNSQAARKLDAQDYGRSAMLLEAHGVTVEEIGQVLHVTTERVYRLLNVRVYRAQPKGGQGEGERKPAKPVVRPAPGAGPRTLTPEQEEVVKSSSGWAPLRTISQLTRELESGVIDTSLPGIADALRKLAKVITGIL